MNRIFALVFLGFAFIVSSPAFAGDQKEKMKDCNKEAKKSALKGDERKAFMSTCLKKEHKQDTANEDDSKVESKEKSKEKSASPAQLKQQEKMKSCNENAKSKSLKGDERKKFMSNCLKKDYEIGSDD